MKRRVVLSFLAVVFLCAANAQVDLSGTWRQSPDDQSAYAQPDFDDSSWKSFELPWKTVETTGMRLPTFWLRRTVTLPPEINRNDLVLTLGPVREVYVVYANGILIGETGPFLEDAKVQIARTRSFRVPATALRDNDRLTIAIRTRFLSFGAAVVTIRPGGSYLLSDSQSAPKKEAEEMLDGQFIRFTPYLIAGGLLGGLALLLLLLWASERGRTDLFWLALLLGSRSFTEFLVLSQVTVSAHPFGWPKLAFQLVLSFGYIILLELTFATMRWRLPTWLRLTKWAALLAAAAWGPFGFACFLADAGAVTVIGVGLWRKRYSLPTTERISALLIVLLAIFQARGQGAFLFVGLNSRFWTTNQIVLGRYQISWQSPLYIILGAGLALLALRRLIADRVDRQRLASELESARVVQQMLIQAPEMNGLSVDAIYLPAQEVGGDFCVVLDQQMIVVGDVSGKGLKAAMQVSAAVGALRTLHLSSPGAILAALNDSLAGHTGAGFVTCVCVRFDAVRMTVANAGHIPPYLNGIETEMDSGLPLGIAPGVDYPETTLPFGPGDRVMLLSDGVVEAENEKRELFGFERTREISTKSAQEIANAALAWGQNDDITVVTVRRNG